MSDQPDSGFERYAVGQPVRRTEDPRLLRGAGRFTDDLNLPGQAHAYVFRSPYAHAAIERLDVRAAAAVPGVLAVLTAADLEAAGFGTLPCNFEARSVDGTPLAKPPRPSLARGRVRYRGEAIAMVVARSALLARDAAERIELDVAELPAVTDARRALGADAPRLHDDVPGNLALDWAFGDEAATERAFAAAHHVTRLALRSNRLVVCALEPRAALAEYDPSSARYTLHVPSQGVFAMRNNLAKAVLGVPPEQLRVRTYDVGGSFGMKSAPYPEYPPLLLAARMLGCPVKWCDERSDSFLSDQHGRDSWAEPEIAFDAEGRILAARVRIHCNVGAYLSPVGPAMHTRNVPRNFPGPYRLPVMYASTRAVFTNTTPVGPYRGAGRPEAVFYMERLMDTAAREMGIDRVELRRRNLLRPDELPWSAVSGLEYDSGDFPAVLDEALIRADWDGFEARRQASAEAGRIRGLGLACYLEVTGPPAADMGGIHFETDGSITMVAGSQNYGQGHDATMAQIVSSRLGVPFERLRLLEGDSDRLIAGAGTGGSRSVISAGSALLAAADRVIEQGTRLAAHVLEAAEADIEFQRGEFRIAGTDRAVSLIDLAARLREKGPPGAGLPDTLDAELAQESPPSAFPNGCHVAEVEIEPDTGVTRVVSYSVVDDFGTIVNPMLVEGQVHGGIAQGMGQALLENVVYDDAGQLLTGSYMDYALPRADDLPRFAFASHPVPARTNPLGAKGCGEAGVTGSLPAVMNAVVDALARETDLVDLEMPASPARVWAALRRG